ncbi:hypothetical protein [Candidatus Palauibacter sp.]|uniref:hypothetical protein n=1 Tax=Candidatus Palauibacter sp. TaxID=3101350 RepID=UPI003B0127A8
MGAPALRVRRLTAHDENGTLSFNGTAENAAGQESCLSFLPFADYDAERRDKYRERLAVLFSGLHGTDNGRIRVVSLSLTASESSLTIKGTALRGNGILNLNTSLDSGDRRLAAYEHHFGQLFEDLRNED